MQKNASRDVKTAMSKFSHHAEPYAASIRVWDSAEAKQVTEDVLFLLPYEQADCIFETTDIDDLTNIDPLSPMNSTMGDWKTNQGIPADEKVAGIGVWGDSAPMNTHDALYVLLWNFITGVWHKRFPFVAFSQFKCCNCGCKGRHTFDDCFRVMGYALSVFKNGTYPTKRDDGIPFSASHRVGDQKRAAWGKKKRRLKVKGGCVQKRADWSWLKGAFGVMRLESGGAEQVHVLEMQCVCQWRAPIYGPFP